MVNQHHQQDWGKEINVFVERLGIQLEQLKAVTYPWQIWRSNW